MTRKMLVLSAFCLVLALGLGGCNQKDDSPRVGVVDAEKVFQGSKLAQSGMAYIESLGNTVNERLAEMQKATTADPENQALMQQLQTELAILQGDFEVKQTEAANKINKVFTEVVEEYRAKNNLEVVLPRQVALASRAGADVTDAIISLLDSRTIDFGAPAPAVAAPVPAPAPAVAAPVPAPAPAAAAPAPAPAQNEAAPAAAGAAETK